MHIESALLTAPLAVYAYVKNSNGLKQAFLAPRRSTLRPLAYGLGAILAAEIGHHAGSLVDILAHVAGGFMLCMAVLEASAWIPRRARAKA